MEQTFNKGCFCSLNFSCIVVVFVVLTNTQQRLGVLAVFFLLLELTLNNACCGCRSGGASFFVVGRDPAGMKGSPQAQAAPDDDLYDAEHGRYVLWMSPGVGSMKMLEFSQVCCVPGPHDDVFFLCRAVW